MKTITLGSTGITVPQNAFGALPVQRVSDELAVKLLRRAYDGGMRFFDTARGYTDSEHKMGLAFGDGYVKREDIIIATKTHSLTPEGFWSDLEESLSLMKTDYIDIYQFHCCNQVFKPGDGTGMYECMLEAKAQGKIRHIAMTTHKIQVAFEGVESGLYEAMQYPLCYLASEKDLELVELCRQKNVAFIAMKGLAGGLITNSKAAMAYMMQFDNVIPIWGVQREHELEEFLSYMDDTPEMDDEITAFIEKEKADLMGNFCRGCGYCLPCPQGIIINHAARMSLMIRRAPTTNWLGEKWQAEMAKIDTCIGCGQCAARCPYELDTPNLLKHMYEDYKKVIAGEISVQ